MSVEIPQCTMYSDNPYHRLLFQSDTRYFPVRRSIEEAASGESPLIHIHWEEHPFRRCRTLVEADLVVDQVVRALGNYKRRGGKIAWTVHNVAPHEGEYTETFERFRGELARCADRILVHSTAAAALLTESVGAAHSRLFYLPHPSYLGIYEPAAQSLACQGTVDTQELLLFGKLRRYKGAEDMLRALAPDATRQFDLRIVGEPLPNDGYADELRAQVDGRSDVRLEVRRVPDDAVPALLRGAAALVLPYRRLLTSGVALLAMTFGTPLLAPDVPQLREVLPQGAHRFLFRDGDGADLRRAAIELLALGPEARQQLSAELLGRANYLHPKRIARQLGDLYDNLITGAGRSDCRTVDAGEAMALHLAESN